MTEIIGIRFNTAGKIYYFAPNGKKADVGMGVIVETARGVEFGTVAIANKMVDESEVVQPLKPITRIATNADYKQLEKNKEKEKEAYIIANEKIAEHKLGMHLVNTEYTFDGSKILFYFTAEGRVDFRELVKTLAGIFKTRIELRQIGVRDEAKSLGAIGICGKALCCSTFLNDFHPVSIKMAKEQGLSLNPTKISGVCGRLMCCLEYEQNVYDEMLKVVPPKGSLVECVDGKGVVIEVETLKAKVKVKFGSDDDMVIRQYDAKDVKVLKKGKAPKEEEEIPEGVPED
ncbi:MAG: stage 0 sporulation protein [Ruminococcaceae bacterium]|nr:stage 0 sporulation protein [Oscillospiraceae bacterium]